MKVLPVALALAYPVLMHVSVAWHDPRLAYLALLALAGALLYRPLRQRRLWAGAALTGISATLYLLWHLGGATYALYLPSLAIPAALCALFGSSLRPGREPLITGVARAARHGVLPPELERYTRRLTQVWTVCFVLMFAVALTLLVLRQWTAWSLFTNFISYGAVAALVFFEYWYRRWRFPEHEHGGFIAHIRTVAASRRSGS